MLFGVGAAIAAGLIVLEFGLSAQIQETVRRLGRRRPPQGWRALVCLTAYTALIAYCSIPRCELLLVERIRSVVAFTAFTGRHVGCRRLEMMLRYAQACGARQPSGRMVVVDLPFESYESGA